jgi:hypothetical protein
MYRTTVWVVCAVPHMRAGHAALNDQAASKRHIALRREELRVTKP